MKSVKRVERVRVRVKRALARKRTLLVAVKAEGRYQVINFA